MVKFRYRVEQRDWEAPQLVTILVQSLFYLRSQSVPQNPSQAMPLAPAQAQVVNYFVPKLPAIIVRMDGLDVEYVKGQQDETSSTLYVSIL